MSLGRRRYADALDRGSPPINAQDERGNKAAVEAIANNFAPDYIALLDGPDVIPHITLDNPVPNDGDSNVASDLPYACPGTYATEASRFLTVTRVVGRIPNVPGAKDPSRVVAFLNTARGAVNAAATNFHNYFGLSAAIWHASTQMSLNAVFGNFAGLAVAPPDLPPATNAQLNRLSHFVNCHGGPIDPNFYGQSGGSYPVALSSAQVAAHSVPGAVIATECCYGAQLYDPILAGVADPICIAYLAAGALGYLGSTNIAYGPANSNGQADLIAQYFFKAILSGASLGRALLQARQMFIASQKLTDPTNLKTLAQFLLLGDPSVTPCISPTDVAVGYNVAAWERVEDATAQRKMRRVTFESRGNSIARGKAVLAGPGEASAAVQERVRTIARERGYRDFREAIFAVRGGSDYLSAAKERAVEENVIVVSDRFEAPSYIVAIRILVAHIIGEGITSIEETVSH